MEGLQYLIDENGRKKAVLLDLDICADKWEDIYDILVSYSRKKSQVGKFNARSIRGEAKNKLNMNKIRNSLLKLRTVFYMLRRIRLRGGYAISKL